jgi:hypothetical protein
MRNRPGSALILVLLMTLAVAGLAVAAIFMSSSAGLLSSYYDRERDFRLAAESGIELVQTRLLRDATLAVPDTGMVQLLSGYRVVDASGTPSRRALVNVFAAVTGDSTGVGLPHVTLIAQAYDASGTRHVRRVDLRRASFSRYAMFVDTFPSGTSFGPGTLVGRAHTNGTWRADGTPVPKHVDTVSAVVGFDGTGTYVDSIVGMTPIPFPRDSTYAWMHTRAAAANLNVTPVAGGSRLEFIALDADGDGTVEEHEGFVRVFDLTSGVAGDTSLLRASPAARTVCNSVLVIFCIGTSPAFHDWNDPIVQNQCGAFYWRSNRWQFFPIATHRSLWARNIIYGPGGANYPQVNNPLLNTLGEYDLDAIEALLSDDIPTARCFPAGSPYLMPTERFTNRFGVVTGNAASDTVPYGVVPPSGGWPSGAPHGGLDTSFTRVIRTCRIGTPLTGGNSGRCVTGTRRTVGTWRAFSGTAVVVPTTVRDTSERRYLWPYAPALNSASSRLLSASSGPLYVSGTVRGPVTVRVAGRIAIVDRLRFNSDPNDPAHPVCTDRLGLVATGDILVVNGLLSRVRRIGRTATSFSHEYLAESEQGSLAPEQRFTVHGSLMSVGGTVGVEQPAETMGDAASQLACPDGAAASTRTNGGCLALTGGAAMRHFSNLGSGLVANSGFRYLGSPDACQRSDRRPPHFPLTNRYSLVRTLEVEPSQANTVPRIRTLLMRLKGRAL